jgi:CheY-like chemotaxis protein
MPSNEALRVLIVEDESLLAMMVEDLVRDAGWSVAGMAASVDEAMRAVERGGFDVALLDVNLAGRNAFPVAEVLLARGVPLVLATGYGVLEIREDLRHLPMVGKPYAAEQLLRTLRDAASQCVGESLEIDGDPAA